MQDSVEYLGYRVDVETSHLNGESQSDHGSTTTEKPEAVEIVSRDGQLLWQIRSCTIDYSSSFEQSIATQCAMEMVEGMSSCVLQVKDVAIISTSVSPLRLISTLDISM